MQRLIDAFKHSIRALRHLLQHEIAFRQETLVFIAGVPAALVIGQTLAQSLILILAIVLVMIVEVINSAIEALGDAVSEDHDARIGFAKDCGSLAVLMAVFTAGVLWVSALIGWLA